MKPISRKKQNQKTAVLVAAALVLLLAMVLITLMSFVSFDMITNRFRAATLDIALYETNFDRLSEQEKATLLPNTLLPKDPKVQNTDQTDAFIFIKVTMPVYYSTKVADDGTKPEARHRQDAFFLKTEEHRNEAATSFNTTGGSSDTEYWVELPECESGTDYLTDTRTYVFGYNVYLKPGETTETLFDYIELKNLIQYEIDPYASMNVQVRAYGVQADHLGDVTKEINGEKAHLTADQLTRVYQLVEAQKES